MTVCPDIYVLNELLEWPYAGIFIYWMSLYNDRLPVYLCFERTLRITVCRDIYVLSELLEWPYVGIFMF